MFCIRFIDLVMNNDASAASPLRYEGELLSSWFLYYLISTHELYTQWNKSHAIFRSCKANKPEGPAINWRFKDDIYIITIFDDILHPIWDDRLLLCSAIGLYFGKGECLPWPSFLQMISVFFSNQEAIYYYCLECWMPWELLKRCQIYFSISCQSKHSAQDFC